MKYSDQLAEWLVQLGYTQCFFVGGGNIMHLIESLSQRMKCSAVIHEVAAGIAAEYYNESSKNGRALALVTAGPGLTNIVTAMAGAYLESRELLVIGGQVKTSDLSRGKLRQRGIQEIDGVSIANPVSKSSTLMDAPISFKDFRGLVEPSNQGRKGPVFIEIPIDIQAREYVATQEAESKASVQKPEDIHPEQVNKIAQLIAKANRPVFLIGGGVSRRNMQDMNALLNQAAIPVATTWNGADRISSDSPIYVGRPNTWGQRSANLIIQQTDLLIAVGTRLGMQQTGFNWQEFVPLGDVIQIDIDKNELDKEHPHVAHPICADANQFLTSLLKQPLGEHAEWLAYTQSVRQAIPSIEPVNQTGEAFISPFVFADQLSDLCTKNDVIVPCSSGGSFTVMMQTFRQKEGQIMVTNKGLASMGYGLSGAIGAGFAHPDRRVVLVEGDGGFAQNLQEIGTAKINNLNLKMFIFDDSGYASIRMTQKSYFAGHYVGCDINTGLGLPNWHQLFKAWDVPTYRVNKGFAESAEFKQLFDSPGTAAFIVAIDPEQTYFPKITSQITESGTMVSNPLHKMTPELPGELYIKVAQHLLSKNNL
jgi:acetolactate synthase-1/2/3 large subunit